MDNTEDVLVLVLHAEADLAYIKFVEGGSLLTKLDVTDLRDRVRFICHIEKEQGNT